MTIKKIIRFISRPATIKVVALICIVGFFFILKTHAEGAGDATTDDANIKKITEGLNTFISLCSRLRVVLAILAGKLMTNDFVYGAFLHMDIYLWKIWNIMKNFANFALAGLVIWSIAKYLLGKESDLKKIIINALVAGILIQASWFLMGAIIDISTVATTGISAFPISFLKTDLELQKKIKDSITGFKSQRTIVNLNEYVTGSNAMRTVSNESTNSDTTDEIRQNILPSYNSVSGPFIYLGMGVFHFQNYLSVDNNTGIKLTFGFALRFLLLFFFTVGLLFLFLANIMRVGLLWIFIIGSPFLILMKVFDSKGGDSGMLKMFNLNNLLAIVFKPVIFVIGISLMLIVIVSMQSSITGSGAQRENNLNGVVLGVTGENTSTLSVEGVSNISVNQKDILGKDVLDKGKNIFSQIIMYLLTLFLMRWFVKLSLTIGGGPIEDAMKKLTGRAEGMAKSMPVLPGGIGFAGAKSILNKSRKKTLGGFGVNEGGEFGERTGKDIETNETKFSNFINDKMSLQHDRSDNDWEELGKLAAHSSNYTSFFSRSKELAKEKRGGLSINDGQWMDGVTKILSTDNKFLAINATLDPNYKFGGRLTATTKEAVEAYFDNPKNAKALYHLMGGRDADKNGPGEPNSYAELANIHFRPNKQ